MVAHDQACMRHFMMQCHIDVDMQQCSIVLQNTSALSNNCTEVLKGQRTNTYDTWVLYDVYLKVLISCKFSYVLRLQERLIALHNSNFEPQLLQMALPRHPQPCVVREP